MKVLIVKCTRNQTSQKCVIPQNTGKHPRSNHDCHTYTSLEREVLAELKFGTRIHGVIMSDLVRFVTRHFKFWSQRTEISKWNELTEKVEIR